jgi:hypothetical protein
MEIKLATTQNGDLSSKQITVVSVSYEVIRLLGDLTLNYGDAGKRRENLATLLSIIKPDTSFEAYMYLINNLRDCSTADGLYKEFENTVAEKGLTYKGVTGRKIDAIKALREASFAGLKESKEAVDKWIENNAPPASVVYSDDNWPRTGNRW